MFRLRLVPSTTKIDFIGLRRLAFVLSLVLVAGSVGVFFVRGLNFGIDFEGGTLMEVRTPQPADIGAMRQTLSGLGLGEVSLQEFGEPTEILIRVQRQEGDEREQLRAIEAVKQALGTDVEYRRTEFVGPKVGDELREAGAWAVLLAISAILLYVWFRFEWQFGIAAIVALTHDVVATIGIFSLLQLEFDLSTLAAVLTIAGYSINDTVVIFDRVRENLRKYKRETLVSLLNRSINDTLARTVMTSMTTLFAVLALYVFGGEVIRGFSFAMMWGIVIGTYSTVFVASPLLLYMRPRREGRPAGELEDAEAKAN